MEPQPSPTITSFVIRFVMTPEAAEAAAAQGLRGYIQHIQTGEAIRFDTWQEATAFIQQFVALDAPGGAPPTP